MTVKVAKPGDCPFWQDEYDACAVLEKAAPCAGHSLCHTFGHANRFAHVRDGCPIKDGDAVVVIRDEKLAAPAMLGALPFHASGVSGRGATLERGVECL